MINSFVCLFNSTNQSFTHEFITKLIHSDFLITLNQIINDDFHINQINKKSSMYTASRHMQQCLIHQQNKPMNNQYI